MKKFLVFMLVSMFFVTSVLAQSGTPVPTPTPTKAAGGTGGKKEAKKDEKKDAGTAAPKETPKAPATTPTEPVKTTPEKPRQNNGEGPTKAKSKVYSLSKIFDKEVFMVQDSKGKKKTFTVFLVATKFDSKGNPLEFGWRRPNGCPFMPKDARDLDKVSAENFAKLWMKVQVLNYALSKRGIGISEDRLGNVKAALRDPHKLMKRHEVRSGTRWDWMTAGDYMLGNEVLSFESNFSIMYAVHAMFPGSKVDGWLYKDSWKGSRDGVEGTYELDFFWAESCGNILVNIRFIPDAPRVTKQDAPPSDGPNLILEGPPTIEGEPEGAPPTPPHDVRKEGFELGTEFWTNWSSEIEADGKGGYKMGGIWNSQNAATVVAEGVKKFGDGENAPYVRGTVHVGVANAGAPSTATDEGAGAGTGGIVHLSIDGVFDAGDQKITVEADVYKTSNSNADAMSIAPTVSIQPEEGNGFVAAVTLVKGNTELKNNQDAPYPIDSVDSDVMVATAGYRFGKNARYAPFTIDSGPYLDLRARYTTQEYTSDLFRSEFSGYGVQITGMAPIKIWTNPNDGVSKEKGLFIYGTVSYDRLTYDGFAKTSSGWVHADHGDGLDNLNFGVNARFVFGHWNPFARE